LSYLPKRSTEIYRAQYGNAMLVFLGGAQIWRPEINEKPEIHFCPSSQLQPGGDVNSQDLAIYDFRI